MNNPGQSKHSGTEKSRYFIDVCPFCATQLPYGHAHCPGCQAMAEATLHVEVVPLLEEPA